MDSFTWEFELISFLIFYMIYVSHSRGNILTISGYVGKDDWPWNLTRAFSIGQQIGGFVVYGFHLVVFHMCIRVCTWHLQGSYIIQLLMSCYQHVMSFTNMWCQFFYAQLKNIPPWQHLFFFVATRSSLRIQPSFILF
jgi:hypothetical protein